MECLGNEVCFVAIDVVGLTQANSKKLADLEAQLEAINARQQASD